MRLIHTTAFALAAAGFAGQASAALILTGVYDVGLSGSTPPRAYEFYSDGATADLSSYSFQIFANGSSSGGSSFTLPAGAAADGEFLYLTPNLTSFKNYFGFDANFSFGNINSNGDDALVLSLSGTRVDGYGTIGTRGGGTWDFENSFAYRNDNTGPTSPFQLPEWTITATGSQSTAAAAGVTVGTYQVPEPASLALVALGGVALLGRRRSA